MSRCIELRQWRPHNGIARREIELNSRRDGGRAEFGRADRAGPSHRPLIKRLEKSGLFRSFTESFETVTGIKLCLIENDVLARTASSHAPGGYSAAAPVRLASSVIAYLVPKRVCDGPESDAAGETDPEQYHAALTLMAYFADQLSRYAEEVGFIEAGSLPVGIIKARKFIHANLGDLLPLPLVARHAALSESHFCRLFKESMGVTFTEYVARARVAWAKRELLQTTKQISEVAFMVGFQSLSQFNRSFSRIVGCSPSCYRSAHMEKFQRMSA